jgi:hypothetical protein
MKYDMISSTSLNTSSHSSTDDTTVRITAVLHFLTEHRIKKNIEISVYTTTGMEKMSKQPALYFFNIKPRKIMWA